MERFLVEDFMVNRNQGRCGSSSADQPGKDTEAIVNYKVSSSKGSLSRLGAISHLAPRSTHPYADAPSQIYRLVRCTANVEGRSRA